MMAAARPALCGPSTGLASPARLGESGAPGRRQAGRPADARRPGVAP